MSKLYEVLSAVIEKINCSIKTEPQTLTDEQKAQARVNIGAEASGTAESFAGLAAAAAETAQKNAGYAAASETQAAGFAASASESQAAAADSAVAAASAATEAKSYRDEAKEMLENAEIEPTNAVLFTKQALTDVQKAQARSNIGAISDSDLAEELAKIGQQKPEFVETIDECTDPSKMYVLPDGYIYAYMTKQEEVVIPGETVTVPAKAVIIKGYRYSKSGGAFQAQSNAAAVVFPIEITKTTTSSNPVDFVLTNMKGHLSYTALYHGSTNASFPNETAARTSVNNSVTNFTVHGHPVGKWFVVFFVQYTGTETFANASFRYDTTTFTVGENMEVYSDPAKASLAAFGSTTTSEGTTEILEKSGFYNTGLTFVSADYGDRIVELENAVEALSTKKQHKNKSIFIDNTMKALTSSVSMTVPQLKKNKTLAFSGTYTGTLSEISIVQGEGSGFTECKCVVTATTITLSKNGASVYTAEHGLTFGSHFSLVLATKNLNRTKAYLSSGGETFASAEFVWNSPKSSVKLYTNVPFTQYRLSFGSNDFDKKIWMYGDSYFDHWLPLSIARGYTNCLTDGYSGGGSSAGLASFRLAMKHGTPEKVVWCLGMNDGDSSAANTSWLNAITAVKQLCDENGIELWVTTIPNVPSKSHTYKNAYIRANFNYIDICKYVGAEESTAWYSGLLSSDNVHPSTEGDFYIAGIMETYFPELLET